MGKKKRSVSPILNENEVELAYPNDESQESGTSFARLCKATVDQLKRNQTVTRATLGHPKADEWSRLRSAVQGILEPLGFHLEIDSDSICVPELEPKRFSTDFFRPYDDFSSKDRIGRLVAVFLRYVQDRNVLLGSGSTVYHVARNMIRLVEDHQSQSRYRQLFWTVNLAVAAELSLTNSDVISRVAIPEGQLRTMTFRFARIREPEWYCPIAVVSADGCLYRNPERNQPPATLYANEASVAENTNLFIDHAVDTVICCLSSRKLSYVEDQGQNAGPPIHNPTRESEKEGVKWFLVTDQSQESKKIDALRDAGWIIVTKADDWLDGADSIRDLGTPFWNDDEYKDFVEL